MSAPAGKIADLLAADAPPGRDFAFEIAVARTIERRRFRRGLAQVVAGGVASAMLLGMLAPTLEAFWNAYFASAGNLMIICGLIAAGALMLNPAALRD